MRETECLVALQNADLSELRAKKRLEALPQRDAIIAVRKRQEEAKNKLFKINELHDGVEAKLAYLQAKDKAYAEKIESTQKLIDDCVDFRSVESLSKELEDAMKAQEKVDFELNSQLEYLERVEEGQAQAQAAIEQLKAKELELAEQFKQEVLNLRAQVAEAAKQREAARGGISEALLKRYDEVKSLKGGIAVGENKGNRCSVCNVTFQEGQRLNLQRGPEIGTCPSCGRILVRL